LPSRTIAGVPAGKAADAGGSAVVPPIMSTSPAASVSTMPGVPLNSAIPATLKPAGSASVMVWAMVPWLMIHSSSVEACCSRISVDPLLFRPPIATIVWFGCKVPITADTATAVGWPWVSTVPPSSSASMVPDALMSKVAGRSDPKSFPVLFGTTVKPSGTVNGDRLESKGVSVSWLVCNRTWPSPK
jgi:hypothetical protein